MAANIHHVVLTVSDADKSADWYKELFGFVELMRDEHHGGGGGHTILVGNEDFSMAVGLAHHPTNGGESFDPTRTGLDHVGFTVPDRATLEKWESTLSEKGITHSPITDHDWGSSLNFRDPDQMQLQLLAFV